MKIVIGLVGENGSGKGTFTDFLEILLLRSGMTLAHYRFSDIIRKTLNLWRVSQTRHNQQLLYQILRNAGWEEMSPEDRERILTNAVRNGIVRDQNDVAVLDGVRLLCDVQMIKEFPQNTLVYITAAPKIRFRRLKERGEKVGESELTWGRFLKESRAPNEVDIPDIGAQADWRIENNGTREELEKKAKTFFETVLKPLLLQ